jgi:hypothetical protein
MEKLLQLQDRMKLWWKSHSEDVLSTVLTGFLSLLFVLVAAAGIINVIVTPLVMIFGKY